TRLSAHVVHQSRPPAPSRSTTARGNWKRGPGLLSGKRRLISLRSGIASPSLKRWWRSCSHSSMRTRLIAHLLKT
ncbi:unnamed protein product, partial [Symbiodinium pilosum]